MVLPMLTRVSLSDHFSAPIYKYASINALTAFYCIPRFVYLYPYTYLRNPFV